MSTATIWSRRHFLTGSGVGLATALCGQAAQQQPRGRLKVAAIYTVFHHRSHAHVILEKFLRPYLFNGKRIQPPVEVVSFYADQIREEGDMTQQVSRSAKRSTFSRPALSRALILNSTEPPIFPASSAQQCASSPTAVAARRPSGRETTGSHC